MKVKLIALDLDHTTLKKADVLSGENRRAIEDAIAEGIEVVAASGRPFDALPKTVLEIPGLRYVITSNGAAVYEMTEMPVKSSETAAAAAGTGTAEYIEHTETDMDYERKIQSARCMHRTCLRKSSTAAILNLMKRYPPGADSGIAVETFIEGRPYAIRAYAEDPAKFGISETYVPYIRNTRTAVDDFPAFVEKHADELDGLDLQINDPVLLEDIRVRAANEVPDVYITASVSNRIEFSDRDAGKAAGIRFLCGYLGIDPAETAAFGDADNDIDMIRQAGIGIAVSNATRSCKEAADKITRAARKDGVAYGIYRYLEVTDRKKEKEERLAAAEFRISHEKFMREALREAEKALALQEVPIGCVIVKDGEIIARGYNRRNTDKNTLAHAEIQAIREASVLLGDWRLEGCTMYVTLEPCQMCSGALVQARMDRVVIGAMNPKAGCAGSVMNLMQVPQFNHKVEIVKGILEEECSRMLQDFFAELRG